MIVSLLICYHLVPGLSEFPLGPEEPLEEPLAPPPPTNRPPGLVVLIWAAVVPLPV
jgi:hypothetical protein